MLSVCKKRIEKKTEKHNHCAVIFKNSIKRAKILAIGTNNNTNYIPIHAEVAAFNKYFSKYRNSNKKVNILIIKRLLRNSKPCNNCSKFLIDHSSFIKNIYFTNGSKIEKISMGKLITEYNSGKIERSSFFKNCKSIHSGTETNNEIISDEDDPALRIL